MKKPSDNVKPSVKEKTYKHKSNRKGAFNKQFPTLSMKVSQIMFNDLQEYSDSVNMDMTEFAKVSMRRYQSNKLTIKEKLENQGKLEVPIKFKTWSFTKDQKLVRKVLQSMINEIKLKLEA
jgi:hypothetical protein